MGKLNRRLNKRNIPKQKSLPLINQLYKEKPIKKKKFKNVPGSETLDFKLSKKIIKNAQNQLFELNGTTSLSQSSTSLTVELDKDKFGFDEPKDFEDFDDNLQNDINENILDFNKYIQFDGSSDILDNLSEVLTEKRSEVFSEFGDDLQSKKMNPKISEMYLGVSKILSQYRSGKLPKAFKIIPSLENWEEILLLTQPNKWTAAVMYQATRLFSSNLNAKLAQRFYCKYLLPRIRDDIAEFKKLNFHLYQALFKAMYKTGAFFKGIIIPMCESTVNLSEDFPPCSLREAYVLCTVLQKNSIPNLHALATMLKLIETCFSTSTEHHSSIYSGPISLILRILLEKKYELPQRVKETLLKYFIGFHNSSVQPLPVLWHQSLLVFTQNYSDILLPEEKTNLQFLIKKQFHPKISPLILNALDGNSNIKNEEQCNLMET